VLHGGSTLYGQVSCAEVQRVVPAESPESSSRMYGRWRGLCSASALPRAGTTDAHGLRTRTIILRVGVG